MTRGIRRTESGVVVTNSSGVTKTVTMLDSFEDGDLSEYDDNASPSEWSVTNSGIPFTPPDGSYVLMNPGSSGSYSRVTSTTSGGGHTNKFPKGSKCRVYVYQDGTSSDDFRFAFACKDGQNRYLALVSGGDMVISKFISGAYTALASSAITIPKQSLWYWDITWDDGTLGGSDNDITMESFDSNGSSIGSITANNSTLANETGFGFVCQDTTDDIYYDAAQLI